MRDFVLFLIVFGAVPVMLLRPHVGALMWAWIAYMVPQRLTWGSAYDFPFALVVAVATILGWLASNEPKRLPKDWITVFLLALTLWVSITTVFAIVPDAAFDKWELTIKILLMAFLTVMLMGTRDRLHALIWVVTASIGLYSVKGGIWMLSGGQGYVWGPERSFIADNNALALATIVVVPLMRYLQLQSSSRLVRWGLGAAMLLSAASLVGSYSRGALLAGVCMLLALFLKSRKRALLSVLSVAMIGIGINFVPANWIERMESIETFEQDESATGRIQAWRFAFKVAMDHPIVGGGFLVNNDVNLFRRHVPEAVNAGSAIHSNYFEVMGEHGFLGLTIFLLLMLSAWQGCAWVQRRVKDRADLQWAADLTRMCQVSIVGYAVAGLFLNKAFFDLYYHLIAIIILAKVIVAREVGSSRVEAWRPKSDATGPPATASIAPRVTDRP